MVLAEEVMLRGAAVTREVAPSKARAVAVNFILLVAVISQVVVVALSSREVRGRKSGRMRRVEHLCIDLVRCVTLPTFKARKHRVTDGNPGWLSLISR
jgi:hypothetical protein